MDVVPGLCLPISGCRARSYLETIHVRDNDKGWQQPSWDFSRFIRGGKTRADKMFETVKATLDLLSDLELLNKSCESPVDGGNSPWRSSTWGQSLPPPAGPRRRGCCSRWDWCTVCWFEAQAFTLIIKTIDHSPGVSSPSEKIEPRH